MKNWEYYHNKFVPLVRQQLEKLTGKNEIWYECWIDFEESKLQGKVQANWWNYIQNYPHLASYVTAKILIKYDKWYDSPKYVEMLNGMLKTSNL